MRTKEEAHDYRYFPDPDLLPLELTAAYVEELKAKLPELPDEKKARFMRGLVSVGIRRWRAGGRSVSGRVRIFRTLVAKCRDAKAVANWVINELFGTAEQRRADARHRVLTGLGRASWARYLS